MAAQRKYPEELRERAVKMVSEIRERDGKGHGELARVGRQLGVQGANSNQRSDQYANIITPGEALRSWVEKQAEIDGGGRPGTTTVDKLRIAELERENRELRRANEILKAASAYFARDVPEAQELRLSRRWINQATSALWTARVLLGSALLSDGCAATLQVKAVTQFPARTM